MTIIRTGVSFAAAAAVVAISAAAPTVAIAKGGKGATLVHCYGVNTCKGSSDCKSYNHDCKGQNDCKGQGFKELTAKKCAAMGGTTSQPN